MSDYGVPSLRKRIIIIGVLNDCDDVLQEYFELQKDKCNSLTEYLTKNNISLDTHLKNIYRHRSIVFYIYCLLIVKKILTSN